VGTRSLSSLQSCLIRYRATHLSSPLLNNCLTSFCSSHRRCSFRPHDAHPVRWQIELWLPESNPSSVLYRRRGKTIVLMYRVARTQSPDVDGGRGKGCGTAEYRHVACSTRSHEKSRDRAGKVDGRTGTGFKLIRRKASGDQSISMHSGTSIVGRLPTSLQADGGHAPRRSQALHRSRSRSETARGRTTQLHRRWIPWWLRRGDCPAASRAIQRRRDRARIVLDSDYRLDSAAGRQNRTVVHDWRRRSSKFKAPGS